MMHRMSVFPAILFAAAIAGCEYDRNAYDRAYSDGHTTRMREQRQSEGSYARADFGEGEPAAVTQRSDGREPRRAEASATPRAEGERQGDRTRFTMAYPTGDRKSSVLLVEKSVPNQVRLNQTFQYEIKVTNITETTLDEVRIREDTPEGLNITASQPERHGQGEQQGWELGALKPKESRSIQVSAVAQREGHLGTCVMASYQPSLCAAINVVNPQLRLTKKSPERVDICEDIVWEYTVTNSGTGTTDRIMVREQLPEGLTTLNGGDTVEMDAGSIREGQTKTGRVKLKATRAGRFTSQAVASSAGGLQAQSTETTTVITQPKLGISIEGPESEYVDRPIPYRVTVTNEGDAPAREAVVMAAVPGASKLVNVGTEGRTSRNAIQWALGTLEPKASKSITFTLSGTEAAYLSAVARASAICATEVSDTARTKIMTISALVLEAVDLADPTRVGENVVYRISVTNQGSGADTNIRITAKLPPEQQYVSTRGTTEAAAEGQTIRFAPVQTLPPGRSATWELTARALQAGDVRFDVQLESDALTKPASKSEPTRLY